MRKKSEEYIRKMTSGQMDWPGMFRRYVFDDTTTPYFTPVDKLTVSQVVSEIRPYAILLGCAALLMSLAYIGGKFEASDSFAASLYCFIVACSALVLGVMRVEPAAWVVASFPLIAGVRLAIGGLVESHTLTGRIIMILVMGCLLFYSWRVIRITRHDPLPDPEPEPERPA